MEERDRIKIIAAQQAPYTVIFFKIVQNSVALSIIGGRQSCEIN